MGNNRVSIIYLGRSGASELRPRSTFGLQWLNIIEVRAWVAGRGEGIVNLDLTWKPVNDVPKPERGKYISHEGQ
jgi:hypothetical protein